MFVNTRAKKCGKNHIYNNVYDSVLRLFVLISALFLCKAYKGYVLLLYI